jgi:hypothetical protein
VNFTKHLRETEFYSITMNPKFEIYVRKISSVITNTFEGHGLIHVNTTKARMALIVYLL